MDIIWFLKPIESLALSVSGLITIYLANILYKASKSYTHKLIPLVFAFAGLSLLGWGGISILDPTSFTQMLSYVLKSSFAPITLVATYMWFHSILKHYNDRELEYHKELAITDGLTGLFNKRFFEARFDEELQRAKRFNRPLSLLLCDLDHFKEYNDTFGHLEGDLLLKDIAAELKASVRTYDLVTRFGGDEFAVILLEADETSAKVVADRIVDSISSFRERSKNMLGKNKVSITIGSATLQGEEDNTKNMINRADKLLYQRKEVR